MREKNVAARMAWWAVCLSAAGLAACGGGGGGATPQQQIAQLEASGALPVLDRTDSLAGIDANGNGVRDDIERYLEVSYRLPKERAAAMQMAAALQAAVLVDKSNDSAVDAAILRVSKGVDCIHDSLAPTEISHRPAQLMRDLEAMTTNTRARLNAYIEFNKAASGSVSSSMKGRACD